MKEDFRKTQTATSTPIEAISNEVSEIVSKGLIEVEKRIDINSCHDNPTITQYARHTLKSGGKRIRSRFILLSFLLFNDTLSDDALNIATAAELFHTGTLLHDDVMDDAKLRRGRETISHKWGSKNAVILGDFLSSRAFSLLLKANSMQIIEAFVQVAHNLGEGVLTEEIHKDDMNLDEETYFFIIKHKTASFFRACASIGAILSERSDEELEHLREFGLSFGIAFQITDDLMDVVSDETTMGKPRGQDILEGHLTLPLIKYFANDNLAIPKGKLSELTPSDIEFKNLLDGLNRDGSLMYSYSKAEEYTNRALASLDFFKEKAAYTLYRKIATELISRKS